MGFADLVDSCANGLDVEVIDNTGMSKPVTNATGLPFVDCLSLAAILNGGMPDGRWLAVVGPFGSMKTTLTNILMGTAHRLQKRSTAHIDAEFASDDMYMRKFGVRVKNKELYKRIEPASGEDGLKITSRILDGTNAHRNKKRNKDNSVTKKRITAAEAAEMDAMDIRAPVILMDSLASFNPGDIMENENDPIGGRARMFSTWFPVIKAKAGKKKAIIITVNQIRSKVMAKGDPETEPGGNPVLFYPDTKIRISRKGSLTENYGPNGESMINIRVKSLKCKHGAPFKLLDTDNKTEIRLVLGVGIDKAWDTFVYLKLTKQITNDPIEAGMPLKQGYWVFSKDRPEICEGWTDAAPYKENSMLELIAANPAIRVECQRQTMDGEVGAFTQTDIEARLSAVSKALDDLIGQGFNADDAEELVEDIESISIEDIIKKWKTRWPVLTSKTSKKTKKISFTADTLGEFAMKYNLLESLDVDVTTGLTAAEAKEEEALLAEVEADRLKKEKAIARRKANKSKGGAPADDEAPARKKKKKAPVEAEEPVKPKKTKRKQKA